MERPLHGVVLNISPDMTDPIVCWHAVRRPCTWIILGLWVTMYVAPASFAQVRVVVPGAPGEANRTLSQEQAQALQRVSYTEADVAFMQGMIHHHAQALEMTELIGDRTDDEQMRLLGMRISLSQQSEIDLMRRWLSRRDEAVPEVTPTGTALREQPMGGMNHRGHGGHQAMTASDDHAGHHMAGMLSVAQMDSLRSATGRDFEIHFLRFMIQHHAGALTMVESLLSSPGAAQESEIYQFSADVETDQRMEINRMWAMLQARRNGE